MTLKEAMAVSESLSSTKRHTVEEIMESLRVWHDWWQKTDWDYRTLPRILIALEQKLGSEAEVHSLLKKAGVNPTRLKNAKRVVKVYDDYVRNGPATMAWFESLDTKKVTLINRATTQHDRFTLRREPIFDGTPAAWSRVEELGLKR